MSPVPKIWSKKTSGRMTNEGPSLAWFRPGGSQRVIFSKPIKSSDRLAWKMCVRKATQVERIHWLSCISWFFEKRIWNFQRKTQRPRRNPRQLREKRNVDKTNKQKKRKKLCGANSKKLEEIEKEKRRSCSSNYDQIGRNSPNDSDMSGACHYPSLWKSKHFICRRLSF